MSPGTAVGFASTSLTTIEPGRGMATVSGPPGVPPGVPLASQPELESHSERAWVGLRATSEKPPP